MLATGGGLLYCFDRKRQLYRRQHGAIRLVRPLPRLPLARFRLEAVGQLRQFRRVEFAATLLVQCDADEVAHFVPRGIRAERGRASGVQPGEGVLV